MFKSSGRGAFDETAFKGAKKGWFRNLSKGNKILTGIGVGAVAIGAGFAIAKANKNKKTGQTEAPVQVEQKNAKAEEPKNLSAIV